MTQFSQSSSSRFIERSWVLGWAVTAYAVLSLGSMATMSIGAALVVVALLVTGLQALVREWSFPWSRRLVWLSFALALSCALSLLVGLTHPLEYGGNGPHIEFFRTLAKTWYLFWPFALVAALRQLSNEERARAIRAWLWAFAALSALAAAQHFAGWPRGQVIPSDPLKRFHATALLGHHLSLASIFIFPFFATLDYCRLDRQRRWVHAAVAALGLFVLYASYSRMLWIALPVGLVAWGIWSLPRNRRWLAFALIAIGLAVAWRLPVVQKRIHHNEGISERYELWKANWEFFKARPLTGVGFRYNEELSGYYFQTTMPPGSYFFQGHAHNNLIHMLGGTGAIGALAWLAWVLFVLWLAWRAAALGPFGRGLACAWLVFHLNGLTQVNFWEGKVMHQMSWVIAWTLLWISMPAGSRSSDAQ